MKVENLDFLSQGPDVSKSFYSAGNVLYYPASALTDFSDETLSGQLRHDRMERKGRFGFNAYSAPFEPSQSWNFPPAYPDQPEYPIRLSFPAENILRVEADYRPAKPTRAEDSLMLCGEPDCI